jgi:hypothetical protein
LPHVALQLAGADVEPACGTLATPSVVRSNAPYRHPVDVRLPTGRPAVTLAGSASSSLPHDVGRAEREWDHA